MAHLQYLPGDPRLVDQLVYELKSKGIFDQFRKDCIADVDTRPAYQNLRQRVENSVATFLSRQCWQPDLNKNQLREKLRKHILDGNYLEQGVERIVDQVVNPKVASVFIPQVEDLVYNYLGVTRKKSIVNVETSNGKLEELLPTDLEAVSPGSVKSNNDKNEPMDIDTEIQKDVKMDKMEVEEEKPKNDITKDDSCIASEVNNMDKEKLESHDTQLSGISELTSHESDVSLDKSSIPLPAEEIKLENIPPPENSPPKVVELEKIELPKEINCSTDIPLPDEIPKDHYFKPVISDEDDSSSDSSLRRNMSPLTPIRNFNNENSCDAQQGFDNDSVEFKSYEKKEPNSFRFVIEAKSSENSIECAKTEKKSSDQLNLAYQFSNQMKINTLNTPLYEDSSNSNNLRIDYESDANSKANLEAKLTEVENSEDSKKEKKADDKKYSHKSSHRSRDSHKNSRSKERRSDSKQSTSRDSSRHDKKSTKDEYHKSKSNHKECSRDRSEKKECKDSSKHTSHKSSSHKDSKSYKSSSLSQRHSSKHSDDKKSSSSSHKDKGDRSSDRSSKDKSKDPKSNSHRLDKDRKSTSKSKHDDKDKDKKEKKETDDHYSVSGRGNPNRRSTDRDSNDGSSSSKGSHHPSSSKSSESKKDGKGSTSKSDNTSTSSDTTSPSDKELTLQEKEAEVIDMLQPKPVVRIETHLEVPIASPSTLPFVPEVILKKPKFAANYEEAKKMMKMRKFLDEEQKRMNQEAALLLEFQANVRPSLSQVYSCIPGPELEFACVANSKVHTERTVLNNNGENTVQYIIDGSNYTEDEGFSDQIDETHIPSTLTVQEVEESIENINEELNNKAEVHSTNITISKDNCNEHYKNILNKTLLEGKKSNATEIDSETIKFEDTSSIVLPELSAEIFSQKHDKKRTEFFEVTIITEEVSDNEDTELEKNVKATQEIDNQTVISQSDESEFRYFAEHEKYSAELERDKFSTFLKSFTEKAFSCKKIYLINCDSYEEKILQEVLEIFGQFEIVNCHRNGHLKLSKKSKAIVKNLNISTEVSLPVDKESNIFDSCSRPVTEPVFSPVKSECSFELSNDYDAKLEEMVKQTSRREIMEIILGNVTSDLSNKMPKIDYFTDSKIDSEMETSVKRKFNEVVPENNNRQVLTPNKMRRISTSDQISSTTHDVDERSNNNRGINIERSKYLGKARRVGLPRPRKTDLPNSPSSDKSVENYEQNSPTTLPTPNGKIRTTSRNKVQRYETSDLYKPKLHYLSRRNNVT